MRQFIGRLLGAVGIGPYYIWWGSAQQFMADLLTLEAIRLGVTGSAQAKIETTAEASTFTQALEFAKPKARELGHPVKVVHFSGGKAWKVYPDGHVDLAPEVELTDVLRGVPSSMTRQTTNPEVSPVQPTDVPTEKEYSPVVGAIPLTWHCPKCGRGTKKMWQEGDDVIRECTNGHRIVVWRVGIGADPESPIIRLRCSDCGAISEVNRFRLTDAICTSCNALLFPSM